jgi:hypothetical protein
MRVRTCPSRPLLDAALEHDAHPRVDHTLTGRARKYIGIERAHHVPDLAAEADHLLSLAQPLAIRAFDDLAIVVIGLVVSVKAYRSVQEKDAGFGVR